MREFSAARARARELGTDPRAGLSAEAVEASRRDHGENRLPDPETKSLAQIFLGSLADRTLLILIGAAILSLVVEIIRGQTEAGYEPHYIDGIAILVAVLIASGVTTLNDWQAARQFRALQRLRANVMVAVRREGKVREIPVSELVVGDLVLFDAGDKIHADGLLLAGAEVALDRSSLTGESEPVDKGEEDLELEGGSTVVSGSGTQLVTAVGTKSEIGKLQASLQDATETQTPLQERLGKLADRIGVVGLGAAILTFLALTLSGALRGTFELGFDMATGAKLLEFAIVAVTIIVVAVPEGLPLAVTISLAYSVRKMARDKNLVRTLASCETMGAATVVCSDKTGTLTENRMTVVAGWVGGQAVETGAGLPASAFTEDAAERVREVVAIDATAHLEVDEDGRRKTVGNPTEGALLAWTEGWGDDWAQRRADADLVHRLGFSSDRKRMSTVIRDGDTTRILVKGAPEVLLERSTRLATSAGERPLDDAARDDARAAVERFSGRGMRSLALAYRDLPKDANLEDDDALESELVLLAVVAIADPVRADVKDALDASRAAGVEVKLVTGDNRATARAIAEQVGLMGEGDVILEGPAFRAMSDAELDEVLPRLRVLARSVPSDKLRLVERLRAHGQVVAVTGDGTNDGPALRSADVGFAMGIAGTEVAKEASDIVLLDDNFASIVAAIQWGRSIFENVRKFLQFQLTVNVVALATAFLAAVLGFGLPLNTVQLLWVNLIMDTLAALALATEPPTPELLEQPPHGRHEPLITRAMATSIGFMGLIMLTCLLGSLLWEGWVPAGTTEGQRLTFVFNAFVFMQIFNEVNARSTRFDRGVWKGILHSPLFVSVIVVTVILQTLIVQLGGAFFRTTPLGPELWIYSVLLGALMLPAGMLMRALGRAFWSGHPERMTAPVGASS
jgi:calcium-translocating P-type ATPase